MTLLAEYDNSDYVEVYAGRTAATIPRADMAVPRKAPEEIKEEHG